VAINKRPDHIRCRRCGRGSKLKNRTIFRELAFDLQFANDEESEHIVKQMIEMKEQEKDTEEQKEMVKTIGANIE